VARACVHPARGRHGVKTAAAELIFIGESPLPIREMPVRITQEQKGESSRTQREKNLRRRSRPSGSRQSGALDPHLSLLDEIRILPCQHKGRRSVRWAKSCSMRSASAVWLGPQCCGGVYSLRSCSDDQVLDRQDAAHESRTHPLQKALRDAREFHRIELVLEDSEWGWGNLRCFRRPALPL